MVNHKKDEDIKTIRYLERRGKCLAYMRKYYMENRERYRQYQKDYYQKKKKKKPEKTKYRTFINKDDKPIKKIENNDEDLIIHFF